MHIKRKEATEMLKVRSASLIRPLLDNDDDSDNDDDDWIDDNE